MQIRELMTANVVTLNATADLDLAEGMMATLRIRHLPVVSGGRLVGLVTHRDLLRASLSSVQRHDPEDEDAFKRSVKIADIMRREVSTISPCSDVREAIERMRIQKYGCLPVVEADSSLVGIVTEADFLKLTGLLLSRLEELDPQSIDMLTEDLERES